MKSFVYRHSELPSVPAEIQAEIVAIGFQIDNLVLRSQGNYRALEQLAEALSDGLDSCELNLNLIRIMPDSPDPDKADKPDISDLKNLSARSKTILFSSGIATQVAIDMLCQATGGNSKVMSDIVAKVVQHVMADTLMSDVDRAIEQFVEQFDGDTVSYVVKIDRK
jgi:hypothetical protein